MRGQKQRENSKVSGIIKRIINNYIGRRILAGALILLVICGIAIGVRSYISSENKTTKIGFEDIGELATQSAYCTVVNVTDASREFFGLFDIPFTQSKYIYSYDIVIKAGIDFEEIEWSEKGKKIEVKLPEVKILSSEINPDSMKIYHEEESIFRQISLEENNEAQSKMRQQAEEDAINSGLLDNARSNAETILRSFFASQYDLQEYEVVFVDK